MRSTILSFLLLLAACGGGNAINVPAGIDDTHAINQRIVSVTIVWGTPSSPYWAYTDMSGDTATITLSSVFATNPAYQDNLIAHELGHAVGLLHSPNPDCFMYAHVSGDINAPCPDEAATMTAFGASNSLRIVSCPGDLVDRVVEAINLWNCPSAFVSFSGSQGE